VTAANRTLYRLIRTKHCLHSHGSWFDPANPYFEPVSYPTTTLRELLLESGIRNRMRTKLLQTFAAQSTAFPAEDRSPESRRFSDLPIEIRLKISKAAIPMRTLDLSSAGRGTRSAYSGVQTSGGISPCLVLQRCRGKLGESVSNNTTASLCLSPYRVISLRSGTAGLKTTEALAILRENSKR
jgi:hypothetical protein